MTNVNKRRLWGMGVQRHVPLACLPPRLVDVAIVPADEQPLARLLSKLVVKPYAEDFPAWSQMGWFHIGDGMERIGDHFVGRCDRIVTILPKVERRAARALCASFNVSFVDLITDENERFEHLAAAAAEQLIDTLVQRLAMTRRGPWITDAERRDAECGDGSRPA